MKTILIKPLRMLACLALISPFASKAQQTVFNDSFASSTINRYSTNSGSATVSVTSYDIASGKNATATTISPGHFALELASTSAGYEEAQGVFMNNQFTPITLASLGDSIDIQFIFTDTTNLFNGKAANAESLSAGLFYSGGSLPLTNLNNGGLSSSLLTGASGGVQNWLGYRGNITYGAGLVSQNASTFSRPAQNLGNNVNQTLIQTGGYANGVNLGQNANIITPLTVGSQYTVDYNITLGTNSSGVLYLYMTNTLYAGVGTGGLVIATNNASAAGANILTTNFDSFVIGGERTGSVQKTNDINQIIITAKLAAQAGPYFTVTGGSGCGGITVGLDGSVATNAYLLYTNGAYTGQSVTGTGSTISFGFQTSAATYTVVASNTATASTGPMWGKAIVTAGAPVFVSQPSSVTCATNTIATFTANVSGSLLGFQWYKNGAALVNGGDVSGAQTTNLVINPARAVDAATVTTGYYLVVTNTCGFAVTSSPNAALTLTAPNHLVWAGGNPNNNWDVATTLNFLNGGNPASFTNGDYVTFDDTSANTAVVITATPTVTTLANVTGSQSYNFSGSGSLGGASSLLVNGAATLTIINANSYSGGTVVSNTANFYLGDGTTQGSASGTITVYSGANLYFNAKNSGDTTWAHNNLAGNGKVTYEVFSGNGSRSINIDPTVTNSTFLGTAEIVSGTRLNVTTAYGLPGTNIIVDDNGTFAGSLNLSGSSITSSVPISIIGHGPGSPIDTPIGNGALRLNGATWSGPITIAGVDPNYNVTTISAASGSATITGNITDNGNGYELEYYGGTISVGPPTGVNTYGITRIAEGLASANVASLTTVVALNANAFSTNTLNMNGWTLLKLNGNNLQFNNLIDESAGGIGYDGAYSSVSPAIQNGNSTNPATITVGQDNNSQAFYGVFGNGGSQPLSLNKVGSGTLTLSGDSTNTGTVNVTAGTLALIQASGNFYGGSPFIGSGSFSNATVLAVANGATLDVSGRTDGTLTLNATQTLKHSGAGTGTINVTGNVNIGSGTLLLAVNHAGLAHDSLAASGSITYGGMLAVTNIGAVLQAGDSFQLFAGATGGFASVNLPTVDAANNAQYTWNNTIGSDGKITVVTVASLINTNAPKVQFSITGSTLHLAWPTNAGWTLLTNSVSLTLTNQWFPYPNSVNLTNVDITINPAKANVFFKMVYPYP